MDKLFSIVIKYLFFNDILYIFSPWNRLVGGIKNTRGLRLRHFGELAMQCLVSNQATHWHSSIPFFLENHHRPQNNHIHPEFIYIYRERERK